MTVDRTTGKDRLACPTDSEWRGFLRALYPLGGAYQEAVLGTSFFYHSCCQSNRKKAIANWAGVNPGYPWNDPTEGVEWDAWWIVHAIREAGDDGLSLTDLFWQKGRDRISKSNRDLALELLLARGLIERTHQRSDNPSWTLVTIYRARRRA